jgi:hypothetical protein
LTNDEAKGLSRETFKRRSRSHSEADEFYDALAPPDLSKDARRVSGRRLPASGQTVLLARRPWWLKGDRLDRTAGRLHGQFGWTHLHNADVIHAGQVGVSLVCGLGFGVSLYH